MRAPVSWRTRTSRGVLLLACCGIASADGCVYLADLEPFPCATDGSCPQGYGCLHGDCRSLGAIAEAAPFPCGRDGSCPDPLRCLPEIGCAVVNECDAFAQNCESGHRCDTIVVNEERLEQCVPDGDVDEGGVCERDEYGFDNCRAGLTCVKHLTQDGSERPTRCREFCGGTDSVPCDAPDRACRYQPDGAIVTCVETCDPGAECAYGYSCVPLSSFDDGYCAPTGTGAQDAPCMYNADCAPRSYCRFDGTVDDVGRCVQLCGNWGGACAAGYECQGSWCDIAAQ